MSVLVRRVFVKFVITRPINTETDDSLLIEDISKELKNAVVSVNNML